MSTYSQLQQIIPPDQALACKGIQASLEQVKSVFNTTLPLLANATLTLESNVGLDSINALTGPLPANVVSFYQTTLATGSGARGLLLLTDLIGTIAGNNVTEPLNNTTVILNSMTSAGDFTALTNSVNGVYTVMENCIAGDYTHESGTGNTTVYTVIIPSGLPGAGSYSGGSPGAAANRAFADGLNPAMISVVGTIAAAYPAPVAATTAYFDVISQKLVNQNANIAAAGIVYANLVAGQQPWGLVSGLSTNGLNIVEGGPAYVLQSVAVTSTQGGQAIISTMRESRNQNRLNQAGIQTDIIVSDQYPEPPANLGTAQYTVAQATSQKII
jgi:hypothetical protein